MSATVYPCSNCGRNIITEPCQYCGYPDGDYEAEMQAVEDRQEFISWIGDIA